jgi:hypothetical protein
VEAVLRHRLKALGPLHPLRFGWRRHIDCLPCFLQLRRSNP